MTTKTDMSASPLIETRADLISVFSGGEKPRDRWRIGTEHEKFVYRLDDHRAPSWDEPGGIRDLLEGLTRFGWPIWSFECLCFARCSQPVLFFGLCYRQRDWVAI